MALTVCTLVALLVVGGVVAKVALGDSAPGPAAKASGSKGPVTMAAAAPPPRVPTTEQAAAAQSPDRERRITEAMRTVDIVFYGASWCPSCRQAKAWLDHEGMAYAYNDVDELDDKRPLRALNPAGTIPVINIEGQVIVGFAPMDMQRAIRKAAEKKLASR